MRESTKQRLFERWFDERHYDPAIFQDGTEVRPSTILSTDHASTHAGFFDLPRELRNLVYVSLWSLNPPVQLYVGGISFRVFYPSYPIIRDSSRKHLKYASHQATPRSTFPPGLLADKQLLSEALEELNRLGIWKAGDRVKAFNRKVARAPKREESQWVRVECAREIQIHLHTFNRKFEKSHVVMLNRVDWEPMKLFTQSLFPAPFANMQILRLRTHIGRHAIYTMTRFSLHPLVEIASTVKLTLFTLDLVDLNMYVLQPPSTYHQASYFREMGWSIPPELLRRGGLNHGEGLLKIENVFKREVFGVGDALVGGAGKHVFGRTDEGWRFEVGRTKLEDID
ncbi:hypothetical protein BDV96DRAFT_321285 [Lophiotrema nucula]|uniref:Uncharacterized protein n=1 Tax=Lophiotrema nucula TaxID=690887 RepID=A0A6A5ZLS3_9PLEO|nr:hypothetical protein BDV96DRAFT_321285 [Lophiotrema nucula]